MTDRYSQHSLLSIILLIAIWMLVGGVAFADSLDLSDDIATSGSALFQAGTVDDLNEVKQAGALLVVCSLVTLGVALLPEHLPLRSPVHPDLWCLHTAPIPLYDSLCVYRL